MLNWGLQLLLKSMLQLLRMITGEHGRTSPQGLVVCPPVPASSSSPTGACFACDLSRLCAFAREPQVES